MAERDGFYRAVPLPSPAAQCGPDRRGRPNALASVGFVPGAKARSAPQSRGLASLVRVTWCSDCSPHGSAGSTGHAEAVVGFTCPKPAGRRCWVATAGDCTYLIRENPATHWRRNRRNGSDQGEGHQRLLSSSFPCNVHIW